MIRAYVEKTPRMVLAVEWYPGIVFDSIDFSPNIRTKKGEEILMEHDEFPVRLYPGYFVTKCALGYEAWTADQFHSEFKRVPDGYVQQSN